MSTMPHCDSRVLHAPGECEYCDRYPAWQEYRQLARIAFTGHEPGEYELPCPSTATRTREVVERWPGNRPRSYTVAGRSGERDIWMNTEENPGWRWPWRRK